MANNWMDQVIINTLNGKTEAVNHLSDKQQTVFIKYFTLTNSSKNNYSYEYMSKDKRFYAHIYKNTMTCKDYKLMDIERIKKAIVLLQEEIKTGFECKYDINIETKEEYIKIRKSKLDAEEIQENKEDLERLEKELKLLEV